MSIDYKSKVSEKWHARLMWAALSDEVKAAIGEFGVEMFALGNHYLGRVSEIRDNGALVILDDGSRWEVKKTDLPNVRIWPQFSKVVVISDEMFILDDTKKAGVLDVD